MKTKLAFASLSLFVFGFSIVFGQEEVTSGKERVKEKLPFAIGNINTLWTGQNTREICIGLWNTPTGPLCCSVKYSPRTFKLNPEKLQYAFPEETELKNIKDPTAYEYKNEYWCPQYPMRIVNGERIPSKWIKTDAGIYVQLNQIVILKLGNKYAALKPLAVEPRYKSLDDMPPEMQKEWRQKSLDGREQWQHWKDGVPPFFGWMTYEWRYWENPSPAPKVATMRTQLQKAGLTPQEITFLLKNE